MEVVCNEAIAEQGRWLVEVLNASRRGRVAPQRVCEINVQRDDVSTALLCAFAGAKYVGLSFEWMGTSPLAARAEKYARLARRKTIIRSAVEGVWSVTAVPRAGRRLLRRCDILLLDQTGTSVEARQSLIFDLPRALQLVRRDEGGGSATGAREPIVILRGDSSCSLTGWKGRAYHGPYWRTHAERCWIESAWGLAKRRDLSLVSCYAHGGQQWYIRARAPVSHWRINSSPHHLTINLAVSWPPLDLRYPVTSSPRQQVPFA